VPGLAWLYPSRAATRELAFCRAARTLHDEKISRLAGAINTPINVPAAAGDCAANI
jgi:hypothetical protein